MHPAETAFTAMRYLAALVELLQEQGIDRDELLLQTGITVGQLSDPLAYASRKQIEQLVNRAILLTGNDSLGLALGQKLNISAHGSLGIAGLTAPTFGAALKVAIDYFPLITTLVAPNLQTSGSTTAIELVPLATLHPDSETFLVQTLLGSTVLMADFQLGKYATTISLELAWPENEKLRQALDARGHRQLKFNTARHRVLFPSQLLQQPFPLADRQTHDAAVKRCRQELQQLDAQRSLAERIYQQLVRQDNLPDMEQLADTLGISSRSLRRRLEAEGWRYRELCNKARINRAKQLLSDDGLSITSVAYQLGYRDSANFSRSFRRETGQAPSEFQKQKKEKQEH